MAKDFNLESFVPALEETNALATQLLAIWNSIYDSESADNQFHFELTQLPFLPMTASVAVQVNKYLQSTLKRPDLEFDLSKLKSLFRQAPVDRDAIKSLIDLKANPDNVQPNATEPLVIAPHNQRSLVIASALALLHPFLNTPTQQQPHHQQRSGKKNKKHKHANATSDAHSLTNKQLRHLVQQALSISEANVHQLAALRDQLSRQDITASLFDLQTQFESFQQQHAEISNQLQQVEEQTNSSSDQNAIQAQKDTLEKANSAVSHCYSQAQHAYNAIQTHLAIVSKQLTTLRLALNQVQSILKPASSVHITDMLDGIDDEATSSNDKLETVPVVQDAFDDKHDIDVAPIVEEPGAYPYQEESGSPTSNPGPDDEEEIIVTTPHKHSSAVPQSDSDDDDDQMGESEAVPDAPSSSHHSSDTSDDDSDSEEIMSDDAANSALPPHEIANLERLSTISEQLEQLNTVLQADQVKLAENVNQWYPAILSAHIKEHPEDAGKYTIKTPCKLDIPVPQHPQNDDPDNESAYITQLLAWDITDAAKSIPFGWDLQHVIDWYLELDVLKRNCYLTAEDVMKKLFQLDSMQSSSEDIRKQRKGLVGRIDRLLDRLEAFKKIFNAFTQTLYPVYKYARAITSAQAKQQEVEASAITEEPTPVDVVTPAAVALDQMTATPKKSPKKSSSKKQTQPAAEPSLVPQTLKREISQQAVEKIVPEQLSLPLNFYQNLTPLSGRFEIVEGDKSYTVRGYMPNLYTQSLDCQVVQQPTRNAWGQPQRSNNLVMQVRGICLPTKTQESLMIDKVQTAVRQQQATQRQRSMWGGAPPVDQYQVQQLLRQLSVGKYGNVAKDIALPRDIDVDNISMQYQDDLISITIPKITRQLPNPRDLNSDMSYTRRQPQAQYQQRPTRRPQQQQQQFDPWFGGGNGGYNGNPFGFY